jgi:hypothetical protein
MFGNFRKGDKVQGRYFGVQYTGTVRQVAMNEHTRNDSVEIDFAEPLEIRGSMRSGLILTNLGEDDELKKVSAT